MQFINNMYQGAQNYYQQIPADAAANMVYGFGVGFIIETIFTSSPSKGVTAGALSGVATAIYALVTPLFRQLTNGRMHLSWGEEMCRTFTAIIGAGCVAAAFGNKSILQNSFMLSIIFGLVIYLVPERGNLNHTHRIVVFPSYQQAVPTT
jgi:hypothetical protein